MTEEEIKQKGIKYATEYPAFQELGYERLGYKRKDLRKSFIAGVNLMQKENDRLAKHILELQKDKGELTDKVKDLEWQLQEVAKDNDYYQEENKRLEQENNRLLDVINNQDVKIADLEKKVNQLEQAKQIINELLAYSVKVEPTDYKLICRAEQFVKNCYGGKDEKI